MLFQFMIGDWRFTRFLEGVVNGGKWLNGSEMRRNMARVFGVGILPAECAEWRRKGERILDGSFCPLLRTSAWSAGQKNPLRVLIREIERPANTGAKGVNAEDGQ